MIHASEGTLQAYLDDELTPSERAELAAHLAQCVSCARELDALGAASRNLTALLTSVDVSVSVEEARLALERARWLQRSRRVRRVLSRAAVLTLFVAGAAAAAIPGSPLRRWVSGLLHHEAPVRVAVPAPAPAAPSAPAAVSIRPLKGRVSVVVSDVAQGTRVHVKLLDSELASVEGRGASAGKFETSPGRIEVSAPHAGDVIVALPRDVPNATVELNGRVVLRKEGQTLHVLEAPVKRSQEELIFEPRH